MNPAIKTTTHISVPTIRLLAAALAVADSVDELELPVVVFAPPWLPVVLIRGPVEPISEPEPEPDVPEAEPEPEE